MIDPLASSTDLIQRLGQAALERPSVPAQRISDGPAGAVALSGSERTATGGAFSDMVGGLVRAVDSKSKAAGTEVRRLMLGESDNIHRSMIAMQESGLAFSLLVEVRNKLVESYQELMRMAV